MTSGERVPTAVDSASRDGAIGSGQRLSLGVAARLSRYLQVLTQAKKMGKETISSRELSDYTHVNPRSVTEVPRSRLERATGPRSRRHRGA